MSPRNHTLGAPFEVPPNLIPRFYRGGARIGAFRGLSDVGSHMSEDWVGSTTHTRASEELGLSRLADGRWLRDLTLADPVGFFGVEHADAFGGESGLLVKLLDAGQRLPVHCHPSRAFAQQFLGSRFGKTEAWHVLSAEPGACVYVGFRRDVAAEELLGLVTEQRENALLDLLNPVEVTAGETLFVPGGLPHSIGAGLLIVEVQEPTDQSVILEWAGFDIDAPTVGHLKLGYETALGAVDRSAWDRDRIETLRRPRLSGGAKANLLPATSRPYFSLERVRADEGAVDLEPSFAILIATRGTGDLTWDDGSIGINAGRTFVVPHEVGEVRATGAIELLRCLGPAPDEIRKESRQ